MCLSSSAVTGGALAGRNFATRTVVPPRAGDWMSNWSISRRAPRSPAPMPLAERTLPESTACRSRSPGPLSPMTISKAFLGGASLIRNSARPPPAYSKALRASSETAVVIRVWSCRSKPRARRAACVRLRTSTMSGSRSSATSSSLAFMSQLASRPLPHRRGRAGGRGRSHPPPAPDGSPRGQDSCPAPSAPKDRRSGGSPAACR